MNFGDNLKKIRKSHKMSQEDLAEKVNVSRQSVSKWETGDAYPEMNNILELCKIFHCRINDLVHTNMDDFNSLDKDIIMKVAKLNDEGQKRVKVISNILFMIGRISKIVLRVLVGVVAVIMIVFPILISSIDVKDGKITAANEYVEVTELKNGDTRITTSKNESVVTDIEKDDVEKIETALSIHSKATFIVLLESGFGMFLVYLLLLSMVMNYLDKLFSNINKGDTPFTIENVSYIKKMSYFMIGCIIASGFGSSLLGLSIGEEISFNTFGIAEILFLYALSYIFEYGYHIQKDSKGVMYDEESSK